MEKERIVKKIYSKIEGITFVYDGKDNYAKFDNTVSQQLRQLIIASLDNGGMYLNLTKKGSYKDKNGDLHAYSLYEIIEKNSGIVIAKLFGK